MKNEKKLLGFSFYINIGNFEVFLRNHLFWKCEQQSHPHADCKYTPKSKSIFTL